MRHLYIGVFVLATAVGAGAQQPPAGTPAGGDKVVPGPVTLTGCVAAGTEKGTFVLTNVVRKNALPPGSPSGASAAAGTGNFVYWLDSAEKLEGHVGHSVEIEGTLDDDVDKSKVKTEDGKTSVTTERTKSVAVPQGTAAAAQAAAGGEQKRLTYKVKVKSLKMVSATCGS